MSKVSVCKINTYRQYEMDWFILGDNYFKNLRYIACLNAFHKVFDNNKWREFRVFDQKLTSRTSKWIQRAILQFMLH